MMGRGHAWLDTGTHESLIEGLALHADHREAPGPEVGFKMGFMSLDEVEKAGRVMAKNEYGQYLLRLVAEERGV
jgi:glucose-1-phosphate thymidylyltransferase